MASLSTQKIRSYLNQPAKISVVCAVIFFTSILFNGTLWKLWGLYRDHNRIQVAIKTTGAENIKVDQKIKLAKDPSYIERQARDKMDLVSENDLIFVFPD